ncbi:MAG: hypothetical protein F6K30_29235, partial [Cyanothece sp. SIO2G6]|nr:hypothetical protein [Cyanothece sp. SIO2G6]
MNQTDLEGFHLSPQQRYLWRSQQDTSSSPYRSRCQVSVWGALDGERLQQAIAQVVDQYEILHTTFQTLPGMSLPLQVIADVPRINLEMLDWRHDASTLPPAALAERLEQLWCDRHQAPLNMVQANTLFAATVVQISDQHTVMDLMASALCMDSSSWEHVLAAIAQNYAGTDSSATSPVVPDDHLGDEDGAGNEDEDGDEDGPIQYIDIAQWQNELLEDSQSDALSLAQTQWRKLNLAEQFKLHLPLEQSTPPQSPAFVPRTWSLTLAPKAIATLEAMVPSYSSPQTVWL